VYPIKHKLKHYDMMKNFIISRTHTQIMELGENLGGSDMMPFPGEDTIMMVYDGCPHLGGAACLA
jgi:hypothetical protein